MAVDKRHIDSEYSRSVKNPGNNWLTDDFNGNQDNALTGEISSYLRACFDIDEVENDPSLPEVELIAGADVIKYKSSIEKNSEIASFIGNSLSSGLSDTETRRELQEVLQEVSEHNINTITSEWVKEWHQMHQQAGRQADKKKTEIQNFITESLEPQSVDIHESEPATKPVKQNTRTRFMRLAVLSTAAMIAVILLVRTLTPGSDPVKLYSSFYEPYPAVVDVTRNYTPETKDDKISLVELYKSKKYQEVVDIYKKTDVLEGSDHNSCFFAGLSSMALMDFTQAITWLIPVAEESDGDLGRDASWYLGLAYLGEGDKENAIKYFKLLSQSDGYYKTRSEKILRRLK